MFRRLFFLCLGVITVSNSASAAGKSGIESTYVEHSRGIAAARAGRYDEGLAALRPLLQRFPDDYPLRRDVILINTWKGDCTEALSLFRYLHSRRNLDSYLIGPIAECAVQRARDGDHDGALDALKALLPHAADNFALRRDIVLITIWKGDCRAALDEFDAIRDDTRLQPYVIVPVQDCLLRERRAAEAAALVDAGLSRYPQEPALLHARARAQVALQLAQGRDDVRPAVRAGVASSSSDQGIHEWSARIEASDQIQERVRLYARYLTSHVDMDELSTGEMRRAGIGVRWQPLPRWRLDQGVSFDIQRAGLSGSHTSVEYQPYETWSLALSYDSYAEDISVRARANDIDASHLQLSAQYYSQRYEWHWRGAAGRYDFTDGNRRTHFYTTLGYAYELLPMREQRIYAEAYQSRNTIEGAPYFNPKSDSSLGLVHRTDFVFDSRFLRHVDHLYVSAGWYEQADFRRRGRWGVRYEQDYDFDSAHALALGAGIFRNVYDGVYEDEWRVELNYLKRF